MMIETSPGEWKRWVDLSDVRGDMAAAEGARSRGEVWCSGCWRRRNVAEIYGREFVACARCRGLTKWAGWVSPEWERRLEVSAAHVVEQAARVAAVLEGFGEE